MPRNRIKYRRARLLAHALALLVFVLLLQGDADASSSVSKQNRNHMKKDKSKLDFLQTYATAKRANGTEIVPDAQGNCAVGAGWRNGAGEIVACGVHPLVASWLSEEETEYPQKPRDVYAGVSLDEGETWKTTDLSVSAEHTTKGRQEHLNYPGATYKPMIKVKGNKILVAWTGKLCSSSGRLLPENETDMFQVKGSQKSVAYDAHLEMGTVPFSCVWTARGTVNGTGGITWYKPEQLTSGRRDANQISAYVLSGVGFGLVWQEDPAGLRAGEAAGPGEGWSGATVNHMTDIWYSFLDWKYFDAIDDPPSGRRRLGEDGPDGNSSGYDGGGNKPFAKYPFSSPVRVSSNAPCRWVNSYEEWAQDHDESDHEHRFLSEGDDGGGHTGGPNITGPMFLGSPYCDVICDPDKLSEPNWKNRTFCVTEDGNVLDGSRGASRAALAIQKDANGEPIAMIGWEETKGNSGRDKGGDDHTHRILSAVSDDAEDVGKNVKFVSFNARNPQPVQVGTILNLPELDNVTQEPLLSEDGSTILTDNARRVRFLTQPLANAGPEGNVALVALWRQGPHGHGKPADVMMRIARGGYGASDFECDAVALVPSDAGPKAILNGEGKVCTKGVVNLSSPRVVNVTDKVTSGTVTKEVTEWSWSGPGNRYDPPGENPYDDARAHRGVLQGDKVFIAYTWTPNWGRGNNGYQAYVVRSFNGFGKDGDGGATSTVKFTDRAGKQEDPKCFSCGMQGGRGHGDGRGVMEPRLVKTPGTIKVTQPDGSKKVISPDDVHNDMVYFAAFGTVENPHRAGRRRRLQGDDHDGGFDAGQKAVSEGLYVMWTDDDFETIRSLDRVTGGDNADGGNSSLSEYKLADSRFVREAQAQLRVNPAGSKLWASYVGDTVDGVTPDDVAGDAAAGGQLAPCGSGSSQGSGVCVRRFSGHDPFGRYKLGSDTVTDNCKKDLKPCSGSDADCVLGHSDLNGDGRVNRWDWEICYDAAAEYAKQADAVAWMGPSGTRALRGGAANRK